jgi:hypothetical protein
MYTLGRISYNMADLRGAKSPTLIIIEKNEWYVIEEGKESYAYLDRNANQ